MPLGRLGLQRSGMLDYPGRVAATIFTMGCPLRCPYCHNPELIAGPVPEHFLTQEAVLQHLARRRTLLQGVVITGGEPLLHRDLPPLISEIARMKLPVKLDTSGFYPDALETLLREPGIQFVAIDFKTLPQHQQRVLPDNSQARTSAAAIQRSMRLLRQWHHEHPGTELEFRTTCAPGVVDAQELLEMARQLEPGDRWRLTPFRPGTCLEPSIEQLPPLPDSALLQAANLAFQRGIHPQLPTRLHSR